MQKQNAHIANTNPPFTLTFFSLKVLKTKSALKKKKKTRKKRSAEGLAKVHPSETLRNSGVCPSDHVGFFNFNITQLISMGIDMQDDKNTHVSKCESVSHSVEFDSLQPHEMCSLSGSSVRRILQARILEWVAISFSRGSS